MKTYRNPIFLFKVVVNGEVILVTDIEKEAYAVYKGYRDQLKDNRMVRFIIEDK